ncbi:MAG: hypothetical protein H0X38_05420 [Planctomycetes bacterium]|nr:hypothetical protein [Planctomycetota bacterium]
MSMRNEARQSRREIESNPMAQVKARNAVAKVDDLQRGLLLLTHRVTVMEALLAQALAMPPEKVKEILDLGVRELARTKTIDELAKETVTCPGCSRNVHRSLKHCQVCGAAVSGTPA